MGVLRNDVLRMYGNTKTNLWGKHILRTDTCNYPVRSHTHYAYIPSSCHITELIHTYTVTRLR